MHAVWKSARSNRALLFGAGACVSASVLADYHFKKTSSFAATAAGKQESGGEVKKTLSEDEFVKLHLKSKERISPNTFRLRFALPTAEHELGLVVASCIVAKAEIEGKAVVRPYTPVSLKNQKGYFDLIVKSYPKPGGLMSRHIVDLREGEILEFKGPFKKIQYTPNMKKQIGMIAGGTGITPMLQIIREILLNPADKTQIVLIFANVNEQDIILKDELDALAALHSNFKVVYTLNNPPPNWKGEHGFVSKAMIEKNLSKPSEDALIMVCGPKGMMEAVCGNKGAKNEQGALSGLLKELNYSEEHVFKF